MAYEIGDIIQVLSVDELRGLYREDEVGEFRVTGVDDGGEHWVCLFPREYRMFCGKLFVVIAFERRESYEGGYIPAYKCEPLYGELSPEEAKHYDSRYDYFTDGDTWLYAPVVHQVLDEPSEPLQGLF